MPQKRFYNYDSTADSNSENSINYALHTKGVYIGMDLTVDSSGALTVASGYGLQHNGVLWQENTSVAIPFTPPMSATEYSVIATHDNRQILGGVKVVYDLLSGALVPDIDNGVVLGWIYYPGGGGPLLQEHCVSAPKKSPTAYADLLDKTKTLELLPPYPGTILTSKDLDITFTPSAFDPGSLVLYQGMANSPMGAGVEQAIQNIQLYAVDGIRPVYVIFYMYCDAPAATNLQVEVYDTDLLSVPVTGGPLIGSGPTWVRNYVTVDRTAGTFEGGLPYTIRLTYNVDLGRDLRIGRISVMFWPYPSVP
jgi:hypothetical protein